MTNPLKDEITAFAHLAHTLSRIGVEKKMWARQADELGMAEIGAKYHSEAAEYRDAANWYMGKARMRKQNHG